MTTYGFDMSWIDTPSTTNKSSNKVRLRIGSVYAFRQSYRGQVSSAEINAFAGSVGENIKSNQSNWATYTQPILNSLTAGYSDTRWGLPKEVDAFTYGLQGSTLLVFNDATSSKADGRYWDTATSRPKTVAESLEDLYETVAGMQTTVTASSSAFDDTALWTAIGVSYETSVKDSLDTRATSLEGHISQLNADIFDAPNDAIDYTYGLGNPLFYSVAHNIDLLLKAHGVTSGWQASPAGVSHSALVIGAHNQASTTITTAFTVSDTTTRGISAPTLDYDIKLLRWEIARTRGTLWNVDSISPTTGSPVASLNSHVNFTGSGTAVPGNPHAINYVDTGQEVINAIIRTYTGMSTNADNSPTYSTTNYVSDGDSLETAIGKLDTGLASAGGGANTLEEAYNEGGAGAGRIVDVNDGAIILRNADNDGDGILELVSNDTTNDNNALKITSNVDSYRSVSNASIALISSVSKMQSIWSDEQLQIGTDSILGLQLENYGSTQSDMDIRSEATAGSSTLDIVSTGTAGAELTIQCSSIGATLDLYCTTSGAGDAKIQLQSYSFSTGDALIEVGYKYVDEVRFSDAFCEASTWGGTYALTDGSAYIPLSISAAEWSTLESNCSGEVSIVGAINTAYAASSGFVTAENLDIDNGVIDDIDTFDPGEDGSIVWHYNITDVGTNLRSGLIFAVWDYTAGTVQYSEASTIDLGDTSDMVLSVDMSGASGNVRLRGLPTGSSNWAVRCERMSRIINEVV